MTEASGPAARRPERAATAVPRAAGLAGPVGPGETVVLETAGPFVPAGELVARQTFARDVPLRAGGGQDGEVVGFVDGDGDGDDGELTGLAVP